MHYAYNSTSWMVAVHTECTLHNNQQQPLYIHIQSNYSYLTLMTMHQTIQHIANLRAIYLENWAVLLQLLNKLICLVLHGHAGRYVCQSDTCH